VSEPPAARSVTAAYLSQGEWSPVPEQLVFTGNGRQSIAAALAAIVPAGGRCGVEALTYPFIKGAAARLGVSLVPLLNQTMETPRCHCRSPRDNFSNCSVADARHSDV
jgi:DNA-binding transcriptional MocR family regulator